MRIRLSNVFISFVSIKFRFIQHFEIQIKLSLMGLFLLVAMFAYLRVWMVTSLQL